VASQGQFQGQCRAAVGNGGASPLGRTVEEGPGIPPDTPRFRFEPHQPPQNSLSCLKKCLIRNGIRHFLLLVKSSLFYGSSHTVQGTMREVAAHFNECGRRGVVYLH
jgi:hypothetical protein